MLAAASALAVATASRSNAASAAPARLSVAQFQSLWNGGSTRAAVDAVLRSRGVMPVIPDTLVADGTYGGNTARALFAVFMAFDRAAVRTAAAWASDMTQAATWAKLATRAADLAPVFTANDVKNSAGVYLVSDAGADVYRIVSSTAPSGIAPAVSARLTALASAIGPFSTANAVAQASNAGQAAVNSATSPPSAPMRPSDASTAANATVATANTQGQAVVAAAQVTPSGLPATTGNSQSVDAHPADYHGPETLYGRVTAGRSVPTAVWVGLGAIGLFAVGYGVMKATEKRGHA